MSSLLGSNLTKPGGIWSSILLRGFRVIWTLRLGEVTLSSSEGAGLGVAQVKGLGDIGYFLEELFGCLQGAGVEVVDEVLGVPLFG